jgi:sporulation and spore germination protein
MKAAERQEFYRRALLGLWALGTLVLLFVIALLVHDMMERGHNPLALPKTNPPTTADTQSDETEEDSGPRMQEVFLYYGMENGMYLAAETRQIAMGDHTVQNCHTLLDALIAGPRDLLAPVVPPSAKVRAMYMLGEGELVIDFSLEMVLEMKKFRSVTAESLMFQSIVNTLTQSVIQESQDTPVTKVRFLVEGGPAEISFPGGHLGLNKALTPDPNWVDPAGEKPSGHV